MSSSIRNSVMTAPDLVLPGFAYSTTAKKGLELVDLASLGIMTAPTGGRQAARGYNSAADIITQTVDGFDLNDLWSEFAQTVALQNAERQRLVDLLTFTATAPMERVNQISSADFEEATEFGEPVGVRPTGAYFFLGYDFRWYDLAARFTWKFLADAPANQVEAINALALDADNRLVFKRVMEALFNKSNRLADIDDREVNVYALYNGDGTVPPAYKSNTFDGTHSHYLTSGATVVESADLDDMVEHLRHHGYSAENGVQLILLANTQQVKTIRNFRVATGAGWDFIPAAGGPASFITQDALGALQVIQGGQAAASYQGLDVAGTYGPVTIIVEDYIPAGYMALIGTGGQANLNNPVGIREHTNASLRGLRLVKGPQADYPLVDSFYQRGFGTGIRQRGGSVVMQITASATYTTPGSFLIQ